MLPLFQRARSAPARGGTNLYLSACATRAPSGATRLAITVEPQTNTPTEAIARGTLELAREQRFALSVQASVQPNPALEVCDVVLFEDGAIGATVCRVSELHLVYYPEQAQHDLVLVAGGR